MKEILFGKYINFVYYILKEKNVRSDFVTVLLS